MSDGIQLKRCTNPNCVHHDDLQPITNFYKDKSRKDGLSSRCKDCIKLQNHNYLNTHREENKKYCHDRYYAKHDEICDQNRKKYWENPEKAREKSRLWRMNNRDKKSESDKLYRNSFAKYEQQSSKLEKYENVRRDPDNPELLQVKCKNSKCQKWFNPTNEQVHKRLWSINHINLGESNFYCSQECKSSCPLYKLRYDLNEKKEKTCNRQDFLMKEVQKIVFERDNYTCQKCGRNKKDELDLILCCHHIIPFSQDPSLASDTNNCITLCEECHIKYHTDKEKFPECTYDYLRRNTKN